ncbi:MAG: presqualene diphosphate synthase HpnD [bacterium]|nr:presqualene diphosphate synthase HpnD [bacterium]
MDSKLYTKQKTKKSGTNFYYSFLFLPKIKREAIYTIYSFCRHSDDIVDDAATPDHARRQLDRWRNELEASYQGTPNHPIAVALTDVLEHFSIPKRYFHELIDGMEMDLHRTRYETFEELSTYCYHAASVVGLMCIEIFGYRSPTARDYAINLGKALQMTNILRDVGDDAQKGRIYLPAEDYQRFHLTEQDLLEQRYSPAFIEFMKFEVDRTRAFYNLAKVSYERRDHHLLFPAEIMRKIYSRILDRIVQDEYEVFSRRISIPKQRKILYALQEWTRGRMRGLVEWAPTL